MFSGVTVVTNACAYYQYTRGCGRAERPVFPAPSDFRRRNVVGKTSGASRRGRAEMCLETNHAVPAICAGNGESDIFLFSIFVDRMFTNLFEPLFTKVFDAPAQTSAISCVYRTRHAD
jgi:hypothetical protein